jgi:hypothetical protein
LSHASFFPTDVSREGARARQPCVAPGVAQGADTFLDGNDSRLDGGELSGFSEPRID